MLKNIFVGNLPFASTEDDLRELFGEYGEVASAKVIRDRDTGRSRGFGFVEMEEADADSAISGLASAELEGRPLRINEAHERRPGPKRY
jgi:RNA recognition motif-containing protein